jgi:hypothetical protein
MMPPAASRPPVTPSPAPVTKPAVRPTLAIQIEAGNVVTAVPRNMAAIGAVAHSGEVSIPPARLPTVITSTETVWKSACAEASSST